MLFTFQNKVDASAFKKQQEKLDVAESKASKSKVEIIGLKEENL